MRLQRLAWGLLPLLLQQPVIAQQARWIAIGTSSRGATIFYDASYISKKAYFTNVRTYERINSPDEDGATQLVFVYRFYCDQNLGTIETIAKFNKAGEIVKYIGNEQADKPVPFKENSTSWKLSQYACP